MGGFYKHVPALYLSNTLENYAMQYLLGLVLILVSATTHAEYDFSKVESFLTTTFTKAGYDGMGMLVWKDGKVVFEEYLGGYDKNTMVPIASASKWLSGATVMSLVDDGQITLDDPLSKYLPAFNKDKLRDITIRQAFSHTSGLGNIRMEPARFRNTPTAEYARLVAQAPLEAEPGSELRYASESMQVVAALAEKVSGKRWEVLFQERITGPLEMTTTGFSRTGDAVNPMLAGGAGSTVSDYANFLTMLISGGSYKGAQILSAGAIREMHANQTGDAPITQASKDRQTRQSRYGIGNWVDKLDAKGDSNQNSSPGAFGMRPWIDWDRNLFGIFFIDRRTAKQEYSGDVYELIDLVHAATD